MGQSWRASITNKGFNIIIWFSLFQTTGDIARHWGSLAAIINLYAMLICNYLIWQHSCSNSFITQATDFYGRNDLDMVCMSIFFSHSHHISFLVATVSAPPHHDTISDEYNPSGNEGLTYEEAKTHFTVWAFMKSPLLIGTNACPIYVLTLQHLTLLVDSYQI